MAPGELHAVLAAGRGPVRGFPVHRRIDELVTDQACATPGRIAVVDGEKQLTYRQVERAASRFAVRLRQAGIGPGSFVPLIMNSSVNLVIAQLAVLKNGAAFAPLAPDWPEERLESVLGQLGSSAAVVDRGEVSRWTWRGITCLCADALCDETDAVDVADAPDKPATPGQPMYCIFTSGSTGTPKGAVNTHAGIINRLYAMTELLGTAAEDVVLATAPATVDSLIWQYYWPLVSGGQVVIAPRNHAVRPELVLECCERHSVTATDFVPAVFAGLVLHLRKSARSAHPLRSLRLILIGGEAIRGHDVAEFRAFHPGVRVFNTYGPTEASVGTVFHEVPANQSSDVPIGRPLANVQTFIVDDHLRPAPYGIPGELCLAGVCVGAGYLGDAIQTAQKFPTIDLPGAGVRRIYRTGDLACMDDDGLIHYLGRQDEQVNINGQRIEPGEITAVLMQMAEIEQAAVSLVPRDGKTPELAAHIVFREDMQVPSGRELRDRLLRKLPRHMVPVHNFVLPGLPLNGAGKLDRESLVRRPGRTLGSGTAGVGGSAITAMREAGIISEVWSGMLGVPDIHADDDFFLDLGADSMTALRAMVEIERRLGVRLGLSLVYSHSSVARLAGRLFGYGRKQGVAVHSPDWDLRLRLHRTLAGWQGQKAIGSGFLYTLNGHAAGPRLFWCCQQFDELMNLATALGAGYPVTGMRSGHLVAHHNSPLIKTIASWYAREINLLKPDGEVILGGNCQGAAMVHAVAKELEMAGRGPVGLIFLEYSDFEPCSGFVTLVFGSDSHLNPARYKPEYLSQFERQCPAGYSFQTVPGAHGSFFRPATVGALARIVRDRVDPGAADQQSQHLAAGLYLCSGGVTDPAA